jgi:hypothetical protein
MARDRTSTTLAVWIAVMLVNLAVPPSARAEPALVDARSKDRLIEAMTAGLAERLAEFDEAVERAADQLETEPRLSRGVLDAALEELGRVDEQTRLIRRAHGRMQEAARVGDEARVRTAFGEAITAAERAVSHLQLVEDMLAVRQPWYPEHVSQWVREEATGDRGEAPSVVPLDPAPWSEPLPPDRLRPPSTSRN